MDALGDNYNSREKANEKYAGGKGTPLVRQSTQARAVGTIKAVANGAVVDMIVDLEIDQTRELYNEVHEHWRQFYAYLVGRGRLLMREEKGQTLVGGPESKNESLPTIEMQIKTTAAHYGITIKGELQKLAVNFMGCSDKTYRTYRDNKWLLSDEKFKSHAKQTPGEYWSERRP